MNTSGTKAETPQMPSLHPEHRRGPKGDIPLPTGQPLAQLAAFINQSPRVQRQLRLRDEINHGRAPSAAESGTATQRRVGKDPGEMHVNLIMGSLPPESSPDSSSLIQRATADVSYQIGAGAATFVAGQAVGLGGVGGETHSEQFIWGEIEDTVVDRLKQGTPVKVDFIVDTTICSDCTPWFEDTVWTALKDAAEEGETTFELKVTVNGHSVVVNGAGTIWPPEIADAPTFERLTNFGRFEKFFNERRDKEGDLMGGNFSAHVSKQGGDLLEVVETYSHEIDGDDEPGSTVETKLTEGRDAAITGQAVQYNLSEEEENDVDKTVEKMHDDMDGIEIYEVVTSGRFNTPELHFEEGEYKEAFERWLAELQTAFQSWMEEYIQDKYEDDRIQSEQPHY